VAIRARATRRWSWHGERTFGREHAELALETMHSTAEEAAQLAAQAGVETLVLMHFSARYRTVEGLVEEARAVFPPTLAATELEWVELHPRPAAILPQQ
jgi:ribonuclease Z